MKIAVLFDGAGLARLGFEQAGHDCTGFEISPTKHYLSKMVGSGKSILADVREVDLSDYEAVWASPPCQKRSQANSHRVHLAERYAEYDDLLHFSLTIPERFTNIKVLWVENVLGKRIEENTWGRKYNAAQFTQDPLQCRNRLVGGVYKDPIVYRSYSNYYRNIPRICPAITASEGKGGVNDFRRASAFYGRRIWLEEAAYHQGFEIPRDLLKSWYQIPHFIHPLHKRRYTWREWRDELYEAIGNGVPVYMARAFGMAYQP